MEYYKLSMPVFYCKYSKCVTLKQNKMKALHFYFTKTQNLRHNLLCDRRGRYNIGS